MTDTQRKKVISRYYFYIFSRRRQPAIPAQAEPVVVPLAARTGCPPG